MSDPEAVNEQNVPFLESAEGEDERGPLEGNAQAVLHLLRIYTLSRRTAEVDAAAFAAFIRANIQRFLLKFPQLEQLSEHTEVAAATCLRTLEQRGLCSLERSGEDIRTIHFPQFYPELIRKAYRELGEHPEGPFPNEEQLGVEIPQALVTDVNIKTEFVSALVETGPEGATILRLAFPEMIRPIVITSELVQKRLLELSVLKLRQFLAMRNNAGYVTHRLNTVLRGHEHALRDMINAVMATPGRALGTLLEPSDFSFRFWAHFANLILQEYKERSDKMSDEDSFCQAAYLIGLYNVHHRGQQQRASEKDTVIQKFEAQFRKHPYAFTLKDLYAVRDDQGMPLIRKNTKDAFTEFLESKTRRDELKGLPELVQVRTVNGKDYYIRRELVIPVFVKMLHEKSQELKDSYLEQWVQLLKDNRRVPAMSEDPEFERDLDVTVRNRYPFFYSLLNQSLLVLAREAASVDYDMSKTLERVLDPKRGSLNPLSQVLGLERREILDSAKLRVPLFQRIALFRNLFYWLQRIFRGFGKALAQSAGQPGQRERRGGRPAHRRGGAGDMAQGRGKSSSGPGGETELPAGSTTLRPSSASQLAAYRKAVENLKLEIAGSERSIPETLKVLMERWNPLYDAQARTELVEDVNSMIRDYFRSLKRTFRASPPTAARVRDLAAKLSENKSFERITRRDVFVRYIEVYMLKLMEER